MRISIDPAIVRDAFSAYKDNPSLQESAQLFAKGLPIAEMIQAFAMNPHVLSAFAGFDSVYPHGNLERGILEKVILAISLRNACQFCVNSHLDITHSLGIPNAHIADHSSPDHTSREQLAIEYAEAMHRDTNRIPQELFTRVRAAFADPEIVELTFLVGFINMLNWFNNALEVRYHREFDGMDVA